MFGSSVGKRRLNSKASGDKKFKAKSSLLNALDVTVTKTVTGYKAFLAQDENTWGIGKSKTEALGHMVEKHPGIFGLVVEEKKRPDPLRWKLFDEIPNFNLDYAEFEKRVLEGLKIPKEMLVMSTPTFGESPLKKAFDDAVKLDILKNRTSAKNAKFALLYGNNFKTNLAQETFQQEYQSMPYIDSEHIGYEHYLSNEPPNCPLCPPAVDL